VRITFLGTSSGKTSIKRFHSSLFISTKKYNLLVDSGDGISRALIQNKIDFNSIDGIIITHLHADHFSGLASLITQMKLANRTIDLKIFIHKSLVDVIKEFLLRSYLIPERMKFKINYKTFVDDKRIKISEGFFFTTKRNSHLAELKKYSTKYPSLVLYSASLLFEWEKKKIIYTSDIGKAEDLFLFKNSHPDVFICEATHIPIETLIKTSELINTGMTFLIHYSDDDENHISEILTSQSKKTPGKIFLAKDRLSFEL
jgi:ribonuclease Z